MSKVGDWSYGDDYGDHLTFDGTIIKTFKSGEIKYLKNGKYHRCDGPAHILPSGKQEWYYDGLLHRLDGPAFITAFGAEFYYVNGRHVGKEVIDWINTNRITYPFSKDNEVLFNLRWADYQFG